MNKTMIAAALAAGIRISAWASPEADFQEAVNAGVASARSAADIRCVEASDSDIGMTLKIESGRLLSASFRNEDWSAQSLPIPASAGPRRAATYELPWSGVPQYARPAGRAVVGRGPAAVAFLTLDAGILKDGAGEATVSSSENRGENDYDCRAGGGSIVLCADNSDSDIGMDLKFEAGRLVAAAFSNADWSRRDPFVKIGNGPVFTATYELPAGGVPQYASPAGPAAVGRGAKPVVLLQVDEAVLQGGRGGVRVSSSENAGRDDYRCGE